MAENRCANWSQAELDSLVDGYELNYQTLTGSLSSRLTNIMKQAAWKEVAENFINLFGNFRVNANSSNTRTWQQIKKKWTTIKSDTRKKNGKLKRELNKTGGGPAPSGLTSTELKIISLIPESSLDGCEGGLESEVFFETDLNVEENTCSSIRITSLDEPSTSKSTEPLFQPVFQPVFQPEEIILDCTQETTGTKGLKRKLTSNKTNDDAANEILSIEREKLGILKKMLVVMTDRLEVEKKRLRLEEEREKNANILMFPQVLEQ